MAVTPRGVGQQSSLKGHMMRDVTNKNMLYVNFNIKHETQFQKG